MFFQMLQIDKELGRERGKFQSYYVLRIYLQTIIVGWTTFVG